jgi:hypothetical protein
MADRKKTHRPSIAFRRRSLDEADRLFASGMAIASRAEAEDAGAFLWNEAGEAYEQSASLFRQADLGLMARDIYEQASYCFGRAGASADARRCLSLANGIPAYWESFR